jgi:hypothetical protein
MVFSQNDMIQMRVDIEIVAGRLIFSVDSLLRIDRHPALTAGRAQRMVFMTLVQALMATVRVVLNVVIAVVVAVSNEVAVMIAMSTDSARLLDASRAHLEMLMVTPSTLNGTTPYREIISGSSVARCL